MKKFFNDAQYQNSPLRALVDFLKKEQSFEEAKSYDDMRFVGYVLDIGFDTVTLITSDPFKQAVGGIPRGSFLIMAPDNLHGLPPHFSLLRVQDTAPTPLAKEVQQTYFELHKKSMPELDIWTKGELQWGALSSKVLGMFYPAANDPDKLSFSGDVNNILSGHRYKIYCPTKELLDLVVNGIVRPEGRFSLGKLRLTECTLPFQGKPQIDVPVQVSTLDFRGFRTAMFGKTRLGKSNVVKLIAQSIMETANNDNPVGQLIFDVNGEYANDNPQDGNKSLRSAYEEKCTVYALTKREKTPSKPLRLNFYEQPDSCIEILASLLAQNNQNSNYIKSFSSAKLPSLEYIKSLGMDERTRPIRKIQYYWAILKKAGYPADEKRLKKLGLKARYTQDFDPHFNKTLREAVYGKAPPSDPTTLDQLVTELEAVNNFRRNNPTHPALQSSGSSGAVFDSDDLALLDFFSPTTGSGPVVLRPFIHYHAPDADNFVTEIIQDLDKGKTVILDLGNATDEIRKYFADLLSRSVFSHQEGKFTSDSLGKHFVQLYFEEAHNIFPVKDTDLTGVYARFAKEGAKFHIGMVYSTQSPSTINKELLAQTENFFVGHMSSKDEASTIAKLQVAYDGLQEDILRTRTPGYMRMLTFSHRFVIPVQANKFEAVEKKNAV